MVISSSSRVKPTKTRPRFFVMLASFAISCVVGLLAGQVGSFLYSLLGQNGGLMCISLPLQLAILALSALISFYATRWFSKRTRPRA